MLHRRRLFTKLLSAGPFHPNRLNSLPTVPLPYNTATTPTKPATATTPATKPVSRDPAFWVCDAAALALVVVLPVWLALPLLFDPVDDVVPVDVVSVV